MVTLSFLDAAYEILKREKRPMGADEIVSMVTPGSFTTTGGKTPLTTMRNQIKMEIKLKGDDSKFMEVKRGKFGLREWLQPKRIVRLRKGTFKTFMYQILKTAGKPMSAKELAKITSDRGMLVESMEKGPIVIASKIRADIKKLGSESLFVLLGKNIFGLREWGLDILKEYISKTGKEKAVSTIEKSRPITGAPMDFRGMTYEPIDKVGVIFLFSKIHQDLDIKVEKIQPGFPEAKCLKKIKRGWKVVWLDFEYKSSDFKEHGHDQDECDILVCWEDDWKDRPPALKVIGLKKVIQDLKGKEQIVASGPS